MEWYDALAWFLAAVFLLLSAIQGTSLKNKADEIAALLGLVGDKTETIKSLVKKLEQARRGEEAQTLAVASLAENYKKQGERYKVAIDDLVAAKGAYEELNAKFSQFRTDAEAVCEQAHRERDAALEQIADGWFMGPPPHIGWWVASRDRNKLSWRWWDGMQWSAAAWPDWDPASAGEIGSIVASPCIQAEVEWTHYYPADARVPRRTPEEWDRLCEEKSS